jgi:hypothetical protein
MRATVQYENGRVSQMRNAALEVATPLGFEPRITPPKGVSCYRVCLPIAILLLFVEAASTVKGSAARQPFALPRQA